MTARRGPFRLSDDAEAAPFRESITYRLVGRGPWLRTDLHNGHTEAVDYRPRPYDLHAELWADAESGADE